MIAADEISNQYLAADDLTIQDITEIKDQKELDQAIEKIKSKKDQYGFIQPVCRVAEANKNSGRTKTVEKIG